MLKTIKKIRVRKWPHLYIVIDIPFLTIRTEIMNKRFDMCSLVIIGLSIVLFKWKFHINLYKSDMWEHE